MRSKNPIFARNAQFNGQPGNGQPASAYGGNAAGRAGYGTPGYADPSTWGTGTPGKPGSTDRATGGRMTIDSVVQKTGISLGVLLLAATATWVLTGNPNDDPTAASQLYLLAMVGAFAGFGLAMVNSFKKIISPPLVMAYAVLQGVFVGAMSKVFQATFGEGVITGAVIGTIAAFAGTLAAYKIFNIQVSGRFRKFVVAAMFGFVALSFLDLGLSFFGASFGFNGFGTMGLISSVVGLALGVLMLILDFDYVERGIAAGLPENESWRAAFGLTVTIVWIYIEMMRILAIFSND